MAEGFHGGAVVENLPASAGDTGSSPGLGRSHMPQSNWAREPQLLSLRVWSLCSATREAVTVRGPRTAMKSGPRSLQLEKALAQKRRPNTAKNKINKFIFFKKGWNWQFHTAEPRNSFNTSRNIHENLANGSSSIKWTSSLADWSKTQSCRHNPQLNLISFIALHSAGHKAKITFLKISARKLYKTAFRSLLYRDFPGGPMVKTPCSQCRGHQSLVGELRSHELHVAAKNK